MPSVDPEALLNFLQEPVFVLAPTGAVFQANTAARRLLGFDPVGHSLVEMLSSPADNFLSYLRHCTGTAMPLVGSISVRKPDGTVLRLRTYGARLAGSDELAQIALRCMLAHQDEFSALAKKVRQLNAEIHERRRIQAILEETLKDNQILLRELHHRVKNNLQMILGLFLSAQMETDSEEVRAFLNEASRRLHAIATVQQLMYQSQEMQGIPAEPFMQALCDASGMTLGPAVRLEVSRCEGMLSNEVAFPLALILNELLTNAFKYGLRNGGGMIRVMLQQDGQDLVLVVHDNGPGFLPRDPTRRSSGLGLVRGLCRQIGGRLEIENIDGARCTVRFSNSRH